RDGLDRTAAVARERGSRVDLWRANELLLRRAGMGRNRIELLGRCTSCEERVFFSHRRDEGVTGRQVAFIAAVS
ncbi:MAG: laccase domain-containing protein, partial [Deltaproteobacteria bacterium]